MGFFEDVKGEMRKPTNTSLSFAYLSFINDHPGNIHNSDFKLHNKSKEPPNRNVCPVDSRVNAP